eukprot:2294552-Pyramimonas_sp.AAC.1
MSASAAGRPRGRLLGGAPAARGSHPHSEVYMSLASPLYSHGRQSTSYLGFGLQQAPYCTLCQHEGRENVVSDVTHILGGCPSETLRKLHCIRHDQTVERVFSSIMRGNRGAVTVLHT